MPTLLQKQNLQKIQEYWVVSTYSNTIKLLMSLILYNYRTFFFTISPIASNTTKASEIFFPAQLLGFFDEIFTSKQPFGILDGFVTSIVCHQHYTTINDCHDVHLCDAWRCEIWTVIYVHFLSKPNKCYSWVYENYSRFL